MIAAKISFYVFVLLNIQGSTQSPMSELGDEKAIYKSGEMVTQSTPITLDQIKQKLRVSGIFDETTASLDDRQKKELKKLFDVVEIMTTSRNRQPQHIQNMFSSLRMMERVIKKQLKEGVISETLADKFQWERLSNRHRREAPAYYLDKKTNMRIFNTSPYNY